MIIDFLHQNNQLSEDKRRQLAQQIFHEVQRGITNLQWISIKPFQMSLEISQTKQLIY